MTLIDSCHGKTQGKVCLLFTGFVSCALFCVCLLLLSASCQSTNPYFSPFFVSVSCWGSRRMLLFTFYAVFFFFIFFFCLYGTGISTVLSFFCIHLSKL